MQTRSPARWPGRSQEARSLESCPAEGRVPAVHTAGLAVVLLSKHSCQPGKRGSGWGEMPLAIPAGSSREVGNLCSAGAQCVPGRVSWPRVGSALHPLASYQQGWAPRGDRLETPMAVPEILSGSLMDPLPARSPGAPQPHMGDEAKPPSSSTPAAAKVRCVIFLLQPRASGRLGSAPMSYPPWPAKTAC